MYVVTGVSGNTGAAAAEALLARKQPVRVVVRDASKGEAWRARGAEVAVAAFEDGDALARALSGASGAYLLLPPFAPSDTDLAARREPVVRGMIHAVRSARPAHVVMLSSIGAQHAAGTGPIAAVHALEGQILEASVPVTFLRAAYFMENWRASLPQVLGAGRLFTGIDVDRKIPMVAARDIGRSAAHWLLEPIAAGRRVVELSGPVEHSPADTAAALSALIGKEIPAVQVPIAGMVGAMVAAGASREFAEGYGEMVQGVNSGLVDWARGGAIPSRGVTPLSTVLGEMLAVQKG